MSDEIVKEARHYRSVDGRHICGLCPHGCRIAPGSRGICGTRLGEGRKLLADNYAKVAAMNIDPMEKKPLYHFHPGELVLSVGGYGCNMSCLHCQNHGLSTVKDGGDHHRTVSPQELVGLCRTEGVRNLAFTYNEPSIWHEYMMDVHELAEGLDLIYVSNGYISPEPREEVLERVAAMNIDVKGFSEEFYRGITKSHLAPVLETAEACLAAGVHLEITYLLIPGLNDDEVQLRGFCEWVADMLDVKVPVHFSAYHRDHLLRQVRDTSAADLLRARSMAADAGLIYTYLGNLPVKEGRDTLCPHCGAAVVVRSGYKTEVRGLDAGNCASCGEGVNMRV